MSKTKCFPLRFWKKQLFFKLVHQEPHSCVNLQYMCWKAGAAQIFSPEMEHEGRISGKRQWCQRSFSLSACGRVKSLNVPRHHRFDRWSLGGEDHHKLLIPISINVETRTNFTISVHVCFLVFIANFYLWQHDSQWCFFICCILPLPPSAFVLYITANISKWFTLPTSTGKLWWMRHRSMQNNRMFWWESKLSTTTHTSSHTSVRSL